MQKMTTIERNEHVEKAGILDKALDNILTSSSNKEIKDILMEFANKCCSIERRRICSNLFRDTYDRLNMIHNLSYDERKIKYEEIEYIQNKIKEEKISEE